MINVKETGRGRNKKKVIELLVEQSDVLLTLNSFNVCNYY